VEVAQVWRVRSSAITMGKRGLAVAGPASKVAKPSEVAVKEDPKFSPVYRLIDQVDIPLSAKHMLHAMAPFALKDGADNRHKFQTKLIDMMSQLFLELETSHKQQLETCQNKFDNFATEKQSLEEAVAEAARQEQEQQTKDTQAKSRCDQQQTHLEEANVTFKSAQQHRDNLEQDKADILKEKPAYEELKGIITESKKQPLSLGNAEQIITLLKPIGPKALVDAAMIALTTKPEERSSFAQQTIEYVDTSFDSHIKSLEEKILSFDTEAESRVAACKLAEEAVCTVRQESENSIEEYIKTQNDLLEFTEKHKALKKQLASLEADSLKRQLQDSAVQLQGTQELIEVFRKCATTNSEAEQQC